MNKVSELNWTELCWSVLGHPACSIWSQAVTHEPTGAFKINFAVINLQHPEYLVVSNKIFFLLLLSSNVNDVLLNK